MTVAIEPISQSMTSADATPPDRIWRQALGSGRVMFGGGVLLFMFLLCVVTLPFTLNPNSSLYYDRQNSSVVRYAPFTAPVPGASLDSDQRQSDFRPVAWGGYDTLGRSIFARCLLGGTISLAVGIAAAMISVALGVTVGLLAGYRGGWIDSSLMRFVDVLYGLPYVLMVVLFKIAFERPLVDGVTWGVALATTALVLAIIAAGLGLSLVGNRRLAAFGAAVIFIALSMWMFGACSKWGGIAFSLAPQNANLVVLFSAIGLVSWLTMARVVRGQVLSIRAQPYIEACRAIGLPQRRIFIRHILPNLIGPITVYATLTVPSAILQESFLSFLGVGVNPPLPTWGSLASDGINSLSPVKIYWWMLAFPCLLLVITLLSLNFVGDGLRDVFDPKKESAKI